MAQANYVGTRRTASVPTLILWRIGMRKTSGSSPTPVGVSERLVECCFVTLRGLEYLHAQGVLELCEGSRAKAAKILGIERTTLRRYLRRAGLR